MIFLWIFLTIALLVTTYYAGKWLGKRKAVRFPPAPQTGPAVLMIMGSMLSGVFASLALEGWLNAYSWIAGAAVLLMSLFGLGKVGVEEGGKKGMDELTKKLESSIGAKASFLIRRFDGSVDPDKLCGERLYSDYGEAKKAFDEACGQRRLLDRSIYVLYRRGNDEWLESERSRQ